MEHRQGSRISAHLDVRISHNNVDLGWFKTGNLSQGGLSIRGDLPGLSANTLVNIKIRGRRPGPTRFTNLRAFTVHHSNDSCGLMWAEQSGEAANLTEFIASKAA